MNTELADGQHHSIKIRVHYSINQYCNFNKKRAFVKENIQNKYDLTHFNL